LTDLLAGTTATTTLVIDYSHILGPKHDRKKRGRDLGLVGKTISITVTKTPDEGSFKRPDGVNQTLPLEVPQQPDRLLGGKHFQRAAEEGIILQESGRVNAQAETKPGIFPPLCHAPTDTRKARDGLHSS